MENKKYYYIYEITNNLNGKRYIGCHETYNLDDGYMGSGKLIKKAILKYGIENFNKKVLSWHNNRNNMFVAERNIIDSMKPEYNLTAGGRGGFGYINSSGLANNKEHGILANRAFSDKMKSNPEMRAEYSRRASELLKKLHGEGVISPPDTTGYRHTDDAKRRISKANRGRTPWNKGIAMSDATKKKISCALTVNSPAACRECGKKIKTKNKTGFCRAHMLPPLHDKRGSIKEDYKTMSLRAVAAKYGTSYESIRRIIKYNPM